MSLRYQQLLGHKPQVDSIDRELDRGIMCASNESDLRVLKSLTGKRRERFKILKPMRPASIVN